MVIYFILPRIIAGDDPVAISVVGAFVIMVVTLYLSHGFNRKTTAAIAGTAISLVLTGLLGAFTLDLARLTGFGSEEAAYVQVLQNGVINLRGVLLGGIRVFIRSPSTAFKNILNPSMRSSKRRPAWVGALSK